MKYSTLVGIVLLFLGCSEKKIEPLVPKLDKEIKKEDQTKIEVDKKILPPEVEQNSSISIVEDLLRIPQDINIYTSYIQDETYKIDKKYESIYFSMWNIEKPKESLEDIKWPFKYFNVTSSYGENLLPIKKSFFDAMYEESNFNEYLQLSVKGVILKYTNIRALPTSRPLLRDPSLAGEGFPFDYLQNSSINANEPVFISHYSKDKQWVFIFSRFTYGWVKNEDVVAIADNYVNMWKDAKQVHIIKEGVALFTQNNEPLFTTRIGMQFALIEEDSSYFTVLTVSKYKNKEAMYHQTKISKSDARLEYLFLNKENLNTVINEVSKTNYGWGGVYEQRDCSSTLMDLYAPFGIALPRNSSKQAEVGQIIDLANMNNKQKLQIIKEKAIPFETLLYKKGHIVLYVGIYKDEVVVFHNTWGIKTKEGKKEGRFIIGKPIFSTLKVGSNLKNYDKDAELLKNIQSMNIITK